MFLTRTVIKRSKIHALSKELFDWNMSRSAFARSLPPSLKIKILEEGEKRTKFLLPIGPLCILWIIERKEKEEGVSFTDELIQGPFVSLEHRCLFTALSDHLTEVEDRVEYRLPFSYIGYIFGNRSAQKRIRSVLNYRHSILKNDLECFERYPKTKLKILIAGGSGFTGSHLTSFLETAGHQVLLLSRKKGSSLYWDPQREEISLDKLENFDAVINLSGENIATFWTKEKKKRLFESRVNTTRFLVSSLNSLKSPPKVLLSASAIGFYGDNKEKILDENAPKGEGFLSDLCTAWEKEALNFKGRTAIMRFGAVLSPDGGALKRLLPAFKAGLGGPLGSGEQVLSWISIDDLLYQLYHLLMMPTLEGIFNFSTPNPVTNRQFSSLLAKQLHRPAYCKVPAALLKSLYGRMAEETLLASTKAMPDRLLQSGAHFAFPDLKSALSHLL
jgi:uncharacterized protein